MENEDNVNTHRESIYHELLLRKINGDELKIDNLTREELKELYSEVSAADIARLFDVRFDKVKYRLRKWNILYSDILKEKASKDAHS
ncbi:hypothetical protein [Calorimonas adulescens]|jgi:hypothetical protein|uniref:Uncharacterized protein n=1 Tax=Calorimonas adulescens TaxID=2606906 RepID=A0A5D8QIC8_9THEO|nr:hypothetical protein [Calorimonas adulescens]TZE83616.1 hypothetical protein FWJ32_01695 [Calorimonas adulescens]